MIRSHPVTDTLGTPGMVTNRSAGATDLSRARSCIAGSSLLREAGAAGQLRNRICIRSHHTLGRRFPAAEAFSRVLLGWDRALIRRRKAYLKCSDRLGATPHGARSIIRSASGGTTSHTMFLVVGSWVQRAGRRKMTIVILAPMSDLVVRLHEDVEMSKPLPVVKLR